MFYEHVGPSSFHNMSFISRKRYKTCGFIHMLIYFGGPFDFVGFFYSWATIVLIVVAGCLWYCWTQALHNLLRRPFDALRILFVAMLIIIANNVSTLLSRPVRITIRTF